MHRTKPTVRKLRDPDISILGANPQEFLTNLAGPAWLEISGQDSRRRRVIFTLLHGNEPSGLIAIHHLLSSGVRPAMNIGIMIAGVDAALYPPILSHRFIPGEYDLNRCFGDRHLNDQSLLAEEMLGIVNAYNPEMLVDTHNTSSHSDAFCISVHNTKDAAHLAGQFSNHLVILNQVLGTLLEHLDPRLPAITVEFGGFMNESANKLALSCLERFMTVEDFREEDNLPEVLTHSIRLETQGNLSVAYSSSVSADSDLTVINTIDQLNFRKIPENTTLGWFGTNNHNKLTAPSGSGTDMFETYFMQDDGLLRTRSPMTIFMATTDPAVANSDCLFYFTPNQAANLTA